MKETTPYPCQSLRDALTRDGLYEPDPAAHRGEPPALDAVPRQWRLAAHPYPLSREDAEFFRQLGPWLLDFYRALNRLYLDSVRGSAPAWVAAYLDQGKPDWLISYARMHRVRGDLPAVIRPDILPTEHGMVVTELDSVPGGIGLTGSLSRAYSEEAGGAADLVGGPDGMVRGFAGMLREHLGGRPGCVAIVVSEESRDYRPEMTWMAGRLREHGLEAYCVGPQDLRFTEESLLLPTDRGLLPVGVIYRFFELFDLKNIPKADLILYSAKKERVVVTPPFKPALEEKLAFALFHHPLLHPFWERELDGGAWAALHRLFPRTWILDPSPIPASATIPGLSVDGRATADWRDVGRAGQKHRRFVVKPSGFSELAWGSRGVSVGHDMAQTAWAEAIERALSSFSTTPYVLQEFHKARQVEISYYAAETCEPASMAGRARLSPYYFVTDGKAELAGILATVCPLDKKVIHGMRDAVMVPCAVGEEP